MPCSGSADSTVASHSRTVESARSRRWVCPWLSALIPPECCTSRRRKLSEGASTGPGGLAGPPPPPPDAGVPIPAEPDAVGPHLSALELVCDIWAADARESRHV